ncbi:hypothetical protein AQ621_16525 (plasmid) [Marinobacter sp. P4B1]|nr:hypothetical protein AQ621_16525 [Marinobacter sp. P4B1]
MRCWRLHLVSEEAVIGSNVADSDHEGNPVRSLEKSFEILTEFLEGNTSRYVVDRRARANGMERDPLVDCGVTGVSISRGTRKDYKVVSVTALVTVKPPGGACRTTHYYAGAISEHDVTDVAAAKARFEEIVSQAIQVRRYYNRLRSEGKFPEAIPRFEDVPQIF